MDIVGLTVLAANLVLGFGGAILVGRIMARATGRESVWWWAAVLVGVYLAESVAVAAGMASQVLTVGLAFVWVGVVGKWLRGSDIQEAWRAGKWCAVYSGLPALSLVLIPVVAALSGKSIISAQGGIGIGIPSLIPWPFCSILGFFGTVAVGAFVLKVLITTFGIRKGMVDG